MHNNELHRGIFMHVYTVFWSSSPSFLYSSPPTPDDPLPLPNLVTFLLPVCLSLSVFVSVSDDFEFHQGCLLEGELFAGAWDRYWMLWH